ncbi:hypothetical protein CMV16_22000 [Peribacillus simplex]|nr:hypothetical protein CMV16_22000 [Peribacillus simplex]
MAESPEHIFLSDYFLEVMYEFSELRLYGFKEADRKKYDFACILEKDWQRPLIGQTLWKHTEGIDKDIRIMLGEKQANIWSYIARDTTKNRALLHEVVEDYKNMGMENDLYRLKVFWVPHDFDADNLESQSIIKTILKESVVTDILFNIVFGTLSANDIRYFLNDTGLIGLNFAVLHEVATNGFINYPQLSKRFEVSAGPLRERIIRLTGSGLLWQLGTGSMYYVSLKGRVFLQIINRLFTEVVHNNTISAEMLFIIRKLGLEPTKMVDRFEMDLSKVRNQKSSFKNLISMVNNACLKWDISLGNENFVISESETDEELRIYR